MSYKFSERSLRALRTCHPELQRLFFAVIRYRDCSVLCGHRNEEDQTEAYTKGYSKAKWGDSKHNSTPSKAIDVAPYPVRWEDKAEWYKFGGFVLGMAACMDIKLKWGGDFKGFFDGPHFELVGGYH